MKQVDGMTY